MIREVLHCIQGAVDDPTEPIGMHLLSHLPTGEIVKAGGSCHLDTKFHRMFFQTQEDQLKQVENSIEEVQLI